MTYRMSQTRASRNARRSDATDRQSIPTNDPNASMVVAIDCVHTASDLDSGRNPNPHPRVMDGRNRGVETCRKSV